MSSKYKLEFAGINIHDIVHINRILTPILPTRENFYKSINSNNGSIYNGFKYEEKIFKVEITIPAKTRTELVNISSRLADILNIKNPSKLIIDDSNIVYYAVLDGDTNIDKLFQIGKATLNFVCYDPIGYDKNYNSLIMDSSNEFKFNDMGTYYSYPTLGFKFSKPATFIYLANEKSEAILIGSNNNTTVETIPENEIIINDNCEDSSKFTDGGNVTVSSNRAIDGNFGVGNDGNSIISTSYGNDVENKWVGPTFRKNLTKNLDEFEVKANFTFSSIGTNFSVLNPKDLVRVVRKSGTYMYKSESDTNTIIQLIPYETDLNILKMGRYTNCQVSYNGQTGWISTNDVGRIKINTTNINKSITKTTNSEEQMGLIEATGFDVNGQVLFRFHIRDDNKFFEHVIPEVYIKDKLYLNSNTTIPIANTVTEKDDEGKPTGETKISSGAFGIWNDYQGTFTIRRKKLDNGKYRWWASINRTKDGINISKEINMGSGIINDSLPNGQLNHIIFYIAKYDQVEPVTVMALNHITVKDISNENKEQNTDVNISIFNENDYLEVNFEKCTVQLNGENFIHKLDIGSQFFNVEKNSIIAVKTDDENLKGSCSYKKRYIG